MAKISSDLDDFTFKYPTDIESSSDDTPLLLMVENNMELNTDPHCHVKPPHRAGHIQKAKKKLILASSLCLIFIAGEVTGGYLSGSLAIMSDAAHMFSDFASFLISLLAIHLGSKRPSKRFTFGLYRAEVLGAFVILPNQYKNRFFTRIIVFRNNVQD